MTTYKGVIEAPRLARVPNALRDLAHLKGADLALSVDKGWLRETVRFTVSGPDGAVRSFVRSVNAAVKDYQQELQQIREN